MTHFKDVCECGKVLAQCKCISPDKVVNVISPCTHEVTTGTMTNIAEAYSNFTFDSLATAYHNVVMNRMRKIPTGVKMNKTTYEILKAQTESRFTVDGVKPIVDPSWTLFGMEIIIDESQDVGDWEFTYSL